MKLYGWKDKTDKDPITKGNKYKIIKRLLRLIFNID